MLKTSVLDNQAEIKRIDKDGMLSFCVEFPLHYERAIAIAEKVVVNYQKPRNIIVVGMGGSAISGEYLKDWIRDTAKIPVEVCREYGLPAYADEETLVFVISYSGETEETLSCFHEALRRKCMIFCVSSGGTLLKIARKMDIPALKVQEGIPPRAAFPYLSAPLWIVLKKIGLITNVNVESSEAIAVLKQTSNENSPRKPLRENFSKDLAAQICGTIPLVYGFGIYRSVAQRFKQQFNENSKIPAFWNTFPELNHNEIVGWECAGKTAKCFSAIIVRDKDEPSEMRKRIEITKNLLDGKIAGIHEVWSKGNGKLAKMLSATLIGDFTSVYLAILRDVDPTPVKTISLLKKELAKLGSKGKQSSQTKSSRMKRKSSKKSVQ